MSRSSSSDDEMPALDWGMPPSRSSSDDEMPVLDGPRPALGMQALRSRSSSSDGEMPDEMPALDWGMPPSRSSSDGEMPDKMPALDWGMPPSRSRVLYGDSEMPTLDAIVRMPPRFRYSLSDSEMPALDSVRFTPPRSRSSSSGDEMPPLDYVESAGRGGVPARRPPPRKQQESEPRSGPGPRALLRQQQRQQQRRRFSAALSEPVRAPPLEPAPVAPVRLPDDTTCSICLEAVWTLPSVRACGHIHCVRCISQWLLARNTCPDCRAPVYTRPKVRAALALAARVRRGVTAAEEAAAEAALDVEASAAAAALEAYAHDVHGAVRTLLASGGNEELPLHDVDVALPPHLRGLERLASALRAAPTEFAFCVGGCHVSLTPPSAARAAAGASLREALERGAAAGGGGAGGFGSTFARAALAAGPLVFGAAATGRR